MILGAVLISFVLVNLLGSSVAARNSTGLLSPEQVAALEHRLGYDKPALERFAEYVGNVATGDLGESIRFGDPALSVVLSGLPYTLMLVAAALALALAIGVPIAIYSVLHQGTRLDRILRRGLMVLQGVPEFWLALILTLVFTQTWALLPSLGYEGPLSLVLPAVALGLPVTPIVARLLRSEMLDVTKQEFVVALRAQNLSSTWIVRRHLLRNAAPVFVTFVALQLGYLVGGTLLVEMVFTWPGIGSTLLDAVQARDLVVIQAIVITVAASFVIVNLLADLFVLWRDPRVRVRAA